MHRMPRVAVLLWISAGVRLWGRGFLETRVDTLVRADALFAETDPVRLATSVWTEGQRRVIEMIGALRETT